MLVAIAVAPVGATAAETRIGNVHAIARWASLSVAQNVAQNTIQAGREVGPNEAGALVQSRTGKRVLNVKTLYRDGHYVHLVKVLSNSGRVHVVQVDARTGTILH